MEQILGVFGIDWRLLLINSFNFGLVLLALWYFLYTPLLNMLEERRKKVAKGVIDAEAAEKKLEEIEDSRAQTLAEAGREADQILSQARTAGSKKEREILTQAQVAAAEIAKEAEAQAKETKVRAITESKEEVAKLIVLGMEKMQKAK